MLVVAGIALGVGLSFLVVDVPSIPTRQSVVVPPQSENDELGESLVAVQVVGEGIEQPGEFEMSPDSTVLDLVRRAGGLRTGAVTEGIRWRATLYDGLRLTVPTHSTIREIKEGDRVLTDEDLIRFRHYSAAGADTEYVNINSASSKELQSLPGIGDVLARRIIEYRRNNGPFEHKEELREVIGIGDITLQEIRSDINLR